MQKLGLQPSSHTYDGFVRAVISEKGFSVGMEVVSHIGLFYGNYLPTGVTWLINFMKLGFHILAACAVEEDATK